MSVPIRSTDSAEQIEIKTIEHVSEIVTSAIHLLGGDAHHYTVELDSAGEAVLYAYQRCEECFEEFTEPDYSDHLIGCGQP